MKPERMTDKAALELAKQLPYAFITELSHVYFGPTPENLDTTEWTEAHFFDETRELRFLPGEGLPPTLLTEESGDRFFDERPTFDGQTAAGLPNGGKNILIRKYIKADGDGQAYIAAVRFTAKEDVE